MMVTFRQIMALAQPAATDKNPVYTIGERMQDKRWINPSGAHDPDDF
jgi:hypothetical protein